MGIVEEGGKVANTAMSAMSGSPLAIALLMVNFGFLALTAYVLGEVANSAQERQQTQMTLIEKLVSDIRDCRQGPRTGLPGPTFTFEYPPSPVDP